MSTLKQRSSESISNNFNISDTYRYVLIYVTQLMQHKRCVKTKKVRLPILCYLF